MGRFEREIGLLGEDGLNRLFASKVAVIGLGGVGGSCAIALARSGVGRLLLLDGDVVEESNLNRQTLFGYSDLGRRKAEAAKEALSPYCGSIEAFDAYLDEGNIDSFLLEGCDFLLDCIDDLKAKIAIIRYCLGRRIPFLSSCGMGKRLDPSKVGITSLDKTYGCPIAKRMRSLLRKEGIDLTKVEVVFSSEPPEDRALIPSSLIMVPSEAGLLLAYRCIGKLAFGE